MAHSVTKYRCKNKIKTHAQHSHLFLILLKMSGTHWKESCSTMWKILPVKEVWKSPFNTFWKSTC